MKTQVFIVLVHFSNIVTPCDIIKETRELRLKVSDVDFAIGHLSLCPTEPGNLFFNHGEMACKDNCITGFRRVQGGIWGQTIGPEKSASVTHIGRGLCACGRATLRIDLSSFFIVWSNCRRLDAISNVNTNTLQILTVYLPFPPTLCLRQGSEDREPPAG